MTALPTTLRLAVASLVLVVAFYVLREHWGHALGVLPYALLLACPLLHLFGGHSHQHSGSTTPEDRR